MSMCYVGRCKCGSIVAAVVAEGDMKRVAKDVAEFIEEGLTIEQMDTKDGIQIQSCKCKKKNAGFYWMVKESVMEFQVESQKRVIVRNGISISLPMKCPKCGATMSLGWSHLDYSYTQWECHNCGYCELIV